MDNSVSSKKKKMNQVWFIRERDSLLHHTKKTSCITHRASRFITFGEFIAATAGEFPRNRMTPVCVGDKVHVVSKMDRDRIRRDAESGALLNRRQLFQCEIELTTDSVTAQVLVNPHGSDFKKTIRNRPSRKEAMDFGLSAIARSRFDFLKLDHRESVLIDLLELVRSGTRMQNCRFLLQFARQFLPAPCRDPINRWTHVIKHETSPVFFAQMNKNEPYLMTRF